MGIAELAVQAAKEFSKPRHAIVQSVNHQVAQTPRPSSKHFKSYSFDPNTGEEYMNGKRTAYRDLQSTTYNSPEIVTDNFFEDVTEGMYHLSSEYHHGIDNSARLRHYSLSLKSFWEDGSFFDMVPVDYRAIGTPVHGFTPHQTRDGWQTVKEEKPKTVKPQISVPYVF